ncbi:MAG TPA: zinc ribbon domain-containing protein [Nitrososphaerales archaeon]|nr:zinc ribbon domain-containing protein [Nitrososphaerales archaeon]
MGLLEDLSKLFDQEQREYGTPSVTMRGEMVKSRAEKQIADYFASNGIRYVYEWRAQTNAVLFKRTFAHPDFYLPDYGVYVEYWGLLGTSKEYERIMKWKMSQYHHNNIRFISLYHDNLRNLDWIFRVKFKKVMGFDIPPNLQSRHDKAKFCPRCGHPTISPARFCTSCGSAIPTTPS